MKKNVLKRALITEKTTKLMANQNKYVFVISQEASKGDVKDTIEKLYGVKVASVKVLQNGHKEKRSWSGKKVQFIRKGNKKAIVEIADGKTLKVFEGS